jgi:deoxyribodipyrimidine photo-lyase
MKPVPPIRINSLQNEKINPDGRFVLYWMIAQRRHNWNFALQRAVEWAGELGKPLVVLEALRLDYPWASRRFHRFVLEGMAANRAAFDSRGVRYFPYLERKRGMGKGLLKRLGGEACVVVTDDYPCFFLPRMVAAAARKLPARLEKVDSNGLLPLATTDRVFSTAFSFRRYLQANLPPHLDDFPAPDPLRSHRSGHLPALPRAITGRWKPLSGTELADPDGLLARLEFPRDVPPVPGTAGGTTQGRQRLRRFLKAGLGGYDLTRNHQETDRSSGLSPYLHFGYLSPHEIFDSIIRREGWSPDRRSSRNDGRRQGWWGMSSAAESFLDQLVTWRELGFHFSARRKDYHRFESLPGWALETLADHSRDRRYHLYRPRQLEQARTHDPLWNAAQRQLLRDGIIHNYLRMLWGKKVLEWSPNPRRALRTLIDLNNRYALDGRDPNSYSGIFWILGRFDRPWGPERPVFGKVRYMSSENTLRKLRLGDYLEQFGPRKPVAGRSEGKK